MIRMRLRTSTLLHYVFSNVTRRASLLSPEIPLCTTPARHYNEIRYERGLLHVKRQIHHIIININEMFLYSSLSSSSSSSSSFLPCIGVQDQQKPRLETISDPDVEETKGEVRMTSRGDKMTTYSEKEQIFVDRTVNSCPTVKRFIAIGSGGDDFVDAMVKAVESVLEEPVPDASVKKRVSSMGRYISVKIGPVQLISRDQVKAVHEAMIKDSRLRYFF